MLQRSEMHIGKRNGPTIVKFDNMITRAMTTHSVETDDKQSNTYSGKHCNEKLKNSLSVFHQHIYNKKF